MSIHGVCFDEGNSGNCGLYCEGHQSYECTIPDEILEHALEDGEDKDEILEFAEHYGLELPNENKDMLERDGEPPPEPIRIIEPEKIYNNILVMASISYRMGTTY